MKLVTFFLTLGAIQATEKRLNVLFIVVDDLRPSIGIYGDKLAVTPHIDSLGDRKGCTVFLHAFAQQSLCAPSRNSFLTSRRPDTTRLYDFYSYWRDVAGNFTTLPQYFKQNGYETFSVGKIFHPGVSSNHSDDMPYSWTHIPYHPSTIVYKNAAVCPGRDDVKHRNLLCPVDLDSQPEETLPDIQSKEEAIRILQEHSDAGKKKPFFLALGFHKPHVPFKFPSQYLSFHPFHKVPLPDNPRKPLMMPDIAWNPWTSVRIRDDMRALNLSFPYGPMPNHYLRLIRQHYMSAVTYTDHQIGEVLNHLDVLGIRNHTIVSVIGDHGWSLGEHQELAKFSNFDAALRVPWILSHPQVEYKKPNYVFKPVELLDLFPTLVDAAGLKPLMKCQNRHELLCTEGYSRWQEVNKKGLHRFSSALSQYPRPSKHPRWSSDKPRLKHIKYMGYSIRLRSFRYTEWLKFDSKTFRADWREDRVIASELYDHNLDPEENFNQIYNSSYLKILKLLKKLLRERNHLHH